MLYRLMMVLSAVILIQACGSSTSVETVTGLSIPESVSVVPNKTDTLRVADFVYSKHKTDPLMANKTGFSALGTDYSKQKVDTWIRTASGGGQLEEINYLLCIVKLNKIADYPNKTYRTKHNAKLCRRPTSAWPLHGEGPVDREMLITTSRNTAADSYNNTMWFQVPYGGPFDNVDWDFVMDMTVNAEPSTESPLGTFELSYRSIRSPDIGINYAGTSDYNGVLKTYQEGSKNYLSYIAFYRNLYKSELSKRYNTYESIIIELDESGSLTGRAMNDEPSGHSDKAYLVRDISKVSFNSDYINEQKNSDSELCSSRTNMLSNVWDYKMFYKDTGKVLDMNGGFDITYGATAQRGWADKYGLWTETEGDAPNTVTSKKDSVVFNVIRAGGKLVKKTKGDRTLVLNEELTYWDNDTETNYKVTWDGSAFISSESGVTDALSELNAASDSSARWPWSTRLNQDIKYTGTSAIVYWNQEDVKPWSSELSGGDLTLTCYQFCPQGTVSQALADVDQWDKSAVIAIDSNAYSEVGEVYTFDSTTMLLNKSGATVILDPSLTSTTHSSFKMRLAPAGSTPTDFWDVDELPVHYVWRSGTKNWEQSINFKSQSTSAWYEFSAPVKFDYTHLTANDLNDDSTNNGINYYLEYDGGLHGIPSVKLADGSKVREISLKDGDIFLGKATHLERELVLKAIGIQKNPQVAPAGSCSSLPLGEVALTLPDIATTVSVSKTWEQQFEASGVPPEYLVIDGEVQQLVFLH